MDNQQSQNPQENSSKRWIWITLLVVGVIITIILSFYFITSPKIQGASVQGFQGAQAADFREKDITNILQDSYKIKSKSDKLKEKGFDSLTIDSLFLTDNVLIKYNKNLKQYPVRIDFKQGLSISSIGNNGNIITGAAIDNTNTNEITQQASDFFDTYQSVIGIDKQDLEQDKTLKAKDLEYVSFSQEYKGIPVHLSRTLLVKSNEKWILFNSNYFEGIDVSTNEKVNSNSAIKIAKQRLSTNEQPVKDPELVVYPFISESGLKYYLAYKIDFPIILSPSERPVTPTVFVDAIEGKVIDLVDNTRIAVATGKINGNVIDDHPGNPKITVDFANEYVSSESSTPTTTDASGNYNFDIASDSEITTALVGPYIIVENRVQDEVFAQVPVPPYQADVFWDDYDTSYKMEESNVFYHANLIHDFFVTGQEPFDVTGLNFQMAANVELSGTCNAYANGVSINFYGPGGGCEALSLSSDVIYHEYVHNMVFIVAPTLASVYWGHTGNMNEGYADYYACSLNENTCLSDNFFSGRECLRSCENIKKFPADYNDEPHSAAEIISGSIWDLRKVVGQETADTLAMLALSYDPQTFQELADNFIISDDAFYGNSDLTDGSPNGQTICESFYLNHGIYSDYCLDLLPVIGKLTLPETIAGKAFINLTGSAGGNEFDHYVLSYQPRNSPSTWNEIITSTESVNDDILFYNFDVSLLDEGSNNFKLELYDISGDIIEITQRIFVDNIKITEPRANAVYRPGEVIEFIGNISGNFDSYTVEYYNPSTGSWSDEGIILTDEGLNEVTDNVVATWDTSMISETSNIPIKISVHYPTKTVTDDFIYIYLDESIRQGWPKHLDWFYGDCFNINDDKLSIVNKNGELAYILPNLVENTRIFNQDNNSETNLIEIRGEEVINDNSEEFNVGLESFACSYWAGSTEPVVDDVNNDGKEEVFVYIAGNPTTIHAFKEDGSVLEGWPVEVNGVDLPGGNIGTPSIADIDNDGFKEIIVNGKENLYVYNHDGTLNKLIYLQIVSQPTTETIIEDLDGDGNLEIIKKYDPVYDGLDYQGDKVAVLDSDGNMLPGWPKIVYQKRFEHGGYHCIGMGAESNPSVGDLDGDGEKEIIVPGPRNVFEEGHDPSDPWDTWHCEGQVHAFNLDGSLLEGFPVDLDGRLLFGSSAIGDLDNNGNSEIVVGTYYSDSRSPNSGLYAIDKNGNVLPGWPQLVGGDIIGTPSLLDYNNDNYLEVIGNDRPYYSYLFDYQGNLFTDWPIFSQTRRSPVVGDLDNDNEVDISANENYGVQAVNIQAQTISSFPKKMGASGSSSSPTLSDIDKDGKVNLIASSESWGERRNTVHAWDIDANYNKDTMQWPMFQHDPRHTGCYDCQDTRRKSKITNNDEREITANLSIEIQQESSPDVWSDYLEVYNKETTILSGETINLDGIFNPLNIIINEQGTYRVYTKLLEENGEILKDFENNQLKAFWEFEIVEQDAVDQGTVDQGTEESCGIYSSTTPTTAIANSEDNPAANSIDTDTDTSWISQTSGGWIYFDLQEKSCINAIDVYVRDEKGADFSNIAIEVSDDAANWNTIETGWEIDRFGSWITKDFVESKGRYLRLSNIERLSEIKTNRAEYTPATS